MTATALRPGLAAHLLGALALAPLAGCSGQPTLVTARNLERPADMTFVCLATIGTGEQRKLSGRPMEACDPPDANPPSRGTVTRILGEFSFITNTARGELSVADMDPAPPQLVDLDPALPGYNTVPIGAFPEAMSSSQDGCQVVTANRGSCDLSLIDPQRLLAPYFGVTATTADPAMAASVSAVSRAVQRVELTTGSHRILKAAPKEVLFLPQARTDLKSEVMEENACGPGNGAYVGPREGTDAVRTPWRALVTLPSCDLVAMIELPSGTIVSSVYLRPDGVEDAGTEPVCPVDCGPGITLPGDAAAAPSPADGATASVDGGPGAAAPAPVRPLRVGALAIRPEGTRVYVGAEGAPFIQALDITGQGLAVPADGGRIPLHESPGGVTRLRLSVDPYKPSPDGTAQGRFVGGRGEFLYAFAQDGSMRLVDVERIESTGFKERECDVNLDPLFLGSLPRGPRHGCYLAGDPLTPAVPRRALAVGPGIRLPTFFAPDQPPPLPRDIAFAQVTGAPIGTTSDPALDGVFGYVLASDRQVYVLSVDPGRFLEDHQLMNHTIVDADLTASASGPPSVNVAPARSFTDTLVPLPIQISATLSRGPRLESTSDIRDGIRVQSWARFPDPEAAPPQREFVRWEGQLPGTGRLEGEVMAPGDNAGPAGGLRDLGADFCDAAVLSGDILLFPGCTQDTDCLPAGTAVCRQASAGTPGLCFPTTEPRDDQFIARCRRYLGSRRRYEVVSSTPQRLEVALKLDEVPRTAFNACTPRANEADDVDCRIAPAFAGFRCLQVRSDEKPRCVQPCGASNPDGDRRCRAGTVCEDVPGSLVGPLCVEGPPLEPSCSPVQARYVVQVGRSFLVTGFMVTGAVIPPPPVARLDGGQCVPDLGRHQFLVNRISLDAPHCENVADGTPAAMALDVIPQGPPGVRGNPCLYQAPNNDETPASDLPHVKALFQNQQFRFVLTNLEDYVGDGASTRFDVVGGFVPLTASPGSQEDSVLSLGVRILEGPRKTLESPGMSVPSAPYVSFPYLFVVDQGRTASGGRGQILRLNPRGGTLGIPRFEGLFNANPFQLQ
jgi:hypothetical protein